MTKLKPCPFCGGEINVQGFTGAPFWFFKCRKCGATISFDNAECNEVPRMAKQYWNRRADNDR